MVLELEPRTDLEQELSHTTLKVTVLRTENWHHIYLLIPRQINISRQNHKLKYVFRKVWDKPLLRKQ